MNRSTGERIVVLANEIEGHPDNVAAATLGGFTIAWTEGETGRAVRLDPADGLAAVAYVPDNRVLTKEARGLLPSVVPHSDAAANAGKAALFVAALTGRPELLLTATEDRLHQEYREPAMPESLSLVHKLRGSGLAAVVSGAGPTVAVLGGPDGDLGRTRRTAGRSTNWELIQSAYRSGRWNPAERGNRSGTDTRCTPRVSRTTRSGASLDSPDPLQVIGELSSRSGLCSRHPVLCGDPPVDLTLRRLRRRCPGGLRSSESLLYPRRRFVGRG